MGKKALALLIAVLTIGQSFAVSGHAALDSSAQTSGTVSSESAVRISSSGNTKTFDVKLTDEDIQRLSKKDTYESITQAVYADGVNPAATELTKGYTVESEKFDMRNVNGKNYVTPVRSQAPFGTCWSFATVAALESSILGSGLKGADGKKAEPETLDLSEKQFAWFSAMPLNIPGHPQNGEGQLVDDLVTVNDITFYMNRGGNAVISEYALMQGIGPCHESSDPQLEYHGKDATIVTKWMDGSMKKYSYSAADDWSVSDDLRFKSDYSVKESHNLPKTGESDKNGYYTYNPEATKAIKQELLNLRAVQVGFYADTSRPGEEKDGEFISKNWAHYSYISGYSNHAVTIVGWDDNYPKENFVKGTIEREMGDGKVITIDKQPPENGAWLVKNSWGSGENEFPNKAAGDWGIENNGVHTGYFWMSYYDKTLSGTNPVSYVVEESDKSINNIDQHDFMPCLSPDAGKFDEEMKMANKFTAAHDELIKQVVCYTTSPDTEVTIDIYLLDDAVANPTDGIRVASRKVKYAYSGMHKENISDFDILFDVCGDGSNRIKVTKDQKYSIVVTQKDAKGKYVINLPNGSNSQYTGFKGIINSGESYVWRDDRWVDYKDDDELRETIMAQLSNGEQSSIDIFSFDNFPIKACTQILDSDTILELKTIGNIYYGTKEHNYSIFRFMMHTNSDDLPDFKESDVVWGILPFTEDEKKVAVSGEKVSDDPTSYKVTAIKDEPESARVYFTIKGVGTLPARVNVNVRSYLYITFPPGKRVYPYTGEEVKPCTGVEPGMAVKEMEPFIEGEDFEFIYSNNVKCGVAKVETKVLSDLVKVSSEVTEAFVIVPAKPVIKNVKAEGTKLVVEIEDQSESEPSGYRLQYRVKGENEWQEVFSKGSCPVVTAYGVSADKTYEVQISGYTEVPEGTEYWYGDLMNYGETSGIKEITTPSAAEAVVRIAGANRYSTAAEISKSAFERCDTVILAYGMNYADALAGVPLAVSLNAPILLCDTKSVPKETLDEIKRLQAKNVIILGGTGAISEEAEKMIKDSGVNCERIAGKSRFATAAAIAEKFNSNPTDVFFVYGLNYADALSVSAAAAIKKAPIIYLTTDGKLNADTAAYLRKIKGTVRNAYVIGGDGVISDAMMSSAVKACGLKKGTRVAGKNRFLTCIEVNKKFSAEFTGTTVCAATGMNFPDALAGGVYAALYRSPLLIVSGSLSNEQKAYLKSKKPTGVTVFGGEGAVPDELAKKILESA